VSKKRAEGAASGFARSIKVLAPDGLAHQADLAGIVSPIDKPATLI